MQQFVCREKHYYNDKIYIMGILNVTPDSFSDGGDFYAVDDAVARALQMQEDGADFIDIGAVSTRPGSILVGEAEEAERLLPVLNALQGKMRVPISVDTFRPRIAEFALQAGAYIINDVSGFSAEMAAVVKRYHAGWILMHSAGAAATEMQYDNGVVCEVQKCFDDFIDGADACGVLREQLMLDPGFGFSKDTQQNKELLEKLKELDTHGSFLLTALSRKRFVGELTGAGEPKDRLEGTLQFNRMAISQGSCVLRVHDVREHKAMIERYYKYG